MKLMGYPLKCFDRIFNITVVELVSKCSMNNTVEIAVVYWTLKRKCFKIYKIDNIYLCCIMVATGVRCTTGHCVGLYIIICCMSC